MSWTNAGRFHTANGSAKTATTVTALAQTAKDMNSKYKETSEAGLALSVVLC